uniref:RNase H type-1 domain-containing protein n=1 Tax=Cannabis sativa TaxID=3483 RepID=A0A803PT87_CANSA
MCGVYAETELHLLVTCQFAGSCWEAAAVGDASRNNSSLLYWLDFNAHRMDSEKLGRLVMLCWALWSVRNDLIWKDCARSVSDVVAFAFSSLDQYVKAQGIKLNVDETIFDRDFKHGFGCVVRNFNGELISAFAGVKIGRGSPELAEAIGIREALGWLKNHGYTRAEVETDSLVCVEAIRSRASFTSGFGLIVEDCKTILKSLINVSIFFVKRSANRAAHFVAHHSMSFAECMFPINRVPLELLSILSSDSSS